SYFFQLLERHLGQGGALVVQAASSAALPQTFARIQSSLRASGLRLSTYEAPIPLQGAVSFIVATRQPWQPHAARLPHGLRFLDAAALERVFAIVTPAVGDAPASTLDHQRAVEAFHHDQARLGN